MTIHFAPATDAAHAIGRAPVCRPNARALIARAMERVGNDNGPRPYSDQPHSNPLGDRMLHAALRHFATHGIHAASAAQAQAMAAIEAGDRQGFAWWLEITRKLDRPMARRLERVAPAPASEPAGQA